MSAASPLGETLLRHGWITRSDLVRARQSQRLMGGDLDSCLLEMGIVSEDLLGRALGEVHGLEPAEVEDLRSVPEEVVALVPKKLAVRCLAVPIRSTASKLHLAVLNPGDLACQDELTFATSRRLVLHAVTEARLREALERYYGEPCDTRFTRLLDRLNRSRYLWGENGDGGGESEGEGDAGDALFPEGPRLTPPSLPTFATGLDTRPADQARRRPPADAAPTAAAAEPAEAEPAAAAPPLRRSAVPVS
ncbi:MAG TPA: hypothetical protein VKU40_04255, partial [Thermoanaerobaculia bacterium]|nr:hypothetical protein [Thermoanaerobaculia bacterium]